MSTRNSNDPNRPVFIYDTHGDWLVTKISDYLWDTRGDYIGYVEAGEVYKKDGEWVGHLSRDGRILRKRTELRHEFHPNPPAVPARPERFPARAPLPPMMAELDFSTVDVLEEEPDTFKRISDFRKDMD